MQLFKLAKECLRVATPLVGEKHRVLLQVALKLGLHVLKRTLTSPATWRRREMVSWLVECATDVGYDALVYLMQHSFSLFTPLEATGTNVSLLFFFIHHSYEM